MQMSIAYYITESALCVLVYYICVCMHIYENAWKYFSFFLFKTRYPQFNTFIMVPNKIHMNIFLMMISHANVLIHWNMALSHVTNAQIWLACEDSRNEAAKHLTHGFMMPLIYGFLVRLSMRCLLRKTICFSVLVHCVLSLDIKRYNSREGSTHSNIAMFKLWIRMTVWNSFLFDLGWPRNVVFVVVLHLELIENMEHTNMEKITLQPQKNLILLSFLQHFGWLSLSIL